MSKVDSSSRTTDYTLPHSLQPHNPCSTVGNEHTVEEAGGNSVS